MKRDIPELPSMRPEPARDFKTGGYLLPHPETGQVGVWDRATTLAGLHEDHSTIEKWSDRQILTGLITDPGLLDLVPDVLAELETAEGWRAQKDAKKKLNKIADAAKDTAGSFDRSAWGTLLHSITEWSDAGRLDEVLPTIKSWGEQGESLLRDLDAYTTTMAGNGLVCPPEYIERILVNTTCSSGGTTDRIVRLSDGRLIIGDLKGLALTTPLPTPTGWTTMGAVQVGDQVFDAFGKPCTVTEKSGIKNIGTYLVRFDDGSKIVCDTEHIWWTQRDYRGKGDPKPRHIKDVIATLTSPQGQKWHRVPVAGALFLPDLDLPVDPYLLGCWLGNGDKRGGTITSMPDLFEVLDQRGIIFGKTCIDPRGNKAVRKTARGLTRQLRQIGLEGHKHIPDIYLRASAEQRAMLLRGLMDTDGTWNTARNCAVFYTVRKDLAVQVVELLATLGQRPHLAEVPTRGFGKEVVSYHVAFTPVDLIPFLLPRKADQAAASVKPTSRSRRRVIVSVEPGPDVPTACIAVDSPNRTYLCGESMIPTHNTGDNFDFGVLKVAAQLAEYAYADALLSVDGKTLEPMPAELDRSTGLLIHLPLGEARCHLIELTDEDMRLGWELAQHAARTLRFRSISRAVTGRRYTPRAASSGDRVLTLINSAGHPDALAALWRDLHPRGEWTSVHTAAARAKKAQLTTTS